MDLQALLILMVIIGTAFCILRVIGVDQRFLAILGYVALAILGVWAIKVLFAMSGGASFSIP